MKDERQRAAGVISLGRVQSLEAAGLTVVDSRRTRAELQALREIRKLASGHQFTSLRDLRDLVAEIRECAHEALGREP